MEISTVLYVVVLSGWFEVGTAACEFIRDTDARHYCRAVGELRPTECEFIRDSARRIECRFEVERRRKAR